ncbi:MAG: MBL fold metallo-hydrolase, partial [Alphaproteobacteria bacterium]
PADRRPAAVPGPGRADGTGAASTPLPGAGGDVPAKSREVAPGIHQVFLPLPSKPSIVNVWLIDGGGEWALVDTGTALEASREALLSVLAALGLAPRDLALVIGTHHHPDHFGASEQLRELGAGEILLHPAELERIEYALSAGSDDMVRHSRRHGIPIPDQPTDAPSPMDVWARVFRPTRRIDRFLADGDEIRVGRRRLRVVATPGHTPGHCCLHEPERGVLLVGDHLLPKITPHVGVYATGPRNPLGDFLDSLEKVARLEVSLVCPAHGGTYSDHRHRASQLVAHHEYRLREMLDTVRGGPCTALEVARRSFRWVFEDGGDRFQLGAAVMETIAHLELLAARGEIVGEDDGRIVRWRDARR